jgi:hypothetical protein
MIIKYWYLFGSVIKRPMLAICGKEMEEESRRKRGGKIKEFF